MAEDRQEAGKTGAAEDREIVQRQSAAIDRVVHRSAFHLDCTGLFPDCRFECVNCLREIHAVFAHVPGVDRLHMEGEGADARLMIVHDPSQVTAEQLLDILKRLPSFHRVSFTPTLLG